MEYTRFGQTGLKVSRIALGDGVGEVVRLGCANDFFARERIIARRLMAANQRRGALTDSLTG
jgi:aryl-alcohol dehydrogenase-like predicted oxidoreductase